MSLSGPSTRVRRFTRARPGGGAGHQRVRRGDREGEAQPLGDGVDDALQRAFGQGGGLGGDGRDGFFQPRQAFAGVGQDHPADGGEHGLQPAQHAVGGLRALPATRSVSSSSDRAISAPKIWSAASSRIRSAPRGG